MGKSNPPQSLVVLFQLLDRQPELVNTVLECVQPKNVDESMAAGNGEVADRKPVSVFRRINAQAPQGFACRFKNRQ